MSRICLGFLLDFLPDMAFLNSAAGVKEIEIAGLSSDQLLRSTRSTRTRLPEGQKQGRGRVEAGRRVAMRGIQAARGVLGKCWDFWRRTRLGE